MDYELLLSAGVIVAFVTGVFSLMVSIINNRKIIHLEKQKQNFSLQQGKIPMLQKIYEETASMDFANTMMMNLHPEAISQDERENGLQKVIEKAENNAKILYNRFMKSIFLIDDDISKKIECFFKEIDALSQQIISLQGDIEANGEKIYKLTLERLQKICILEDEYCSLLAEQLQRLLKVS